MGTSIGVGHGEQVVDLLLEVVLLLVFSHSEEVVVYLREDIAEIGLLLKLYLLGLTSRVIPSLIFS